jgi:tight adherence protein C
MNSYLLGAMVGLSLATGVIIAGRNAPPMRPVRLVDRIAPYLGGAPPPSRLLERPGATSAPFTVIRALFAPVAGEAVGLLDRIVGGDASLRRRLGGLGRRLTVEEFRLEQVVCGSVGMVVGALLILLLCLLRGSADPVMVAAGALGGLVAGILGRDWLLTRQLKRREQAMLAEFPMVADLLALSVVAGEAPADALLRVSRLIGGELAGDLDEALTRMRSGTPLIKTLSELAERTTLESMTRFWEGLVVGIERGTPLADVLRAQAVDVRAAAKRSLLESGGKKEISMTVPVVFLILPVTVLFALYPGLLTLESFAH